MVVPDHEVIDLSSDDSDNESCEYCKKAAREKRMAAKRKEAARQRRRGAKLTKRGPNSKKEDTYDKYCVFGNNVGLDHDQVKYLKRKVALQKPTIPWYVCTMQDANIVAPSAKMYFAKEYNRYFKKHLALPGKVHVWYNKNYVAEVRMIFGKGRGKGAMITSKWPAVVKQTNMEKGDIFLFWFRRSSNGLRLMVEEVV